MMKLLDRLFGRTEPEAPAPEAPAIEATKSRKKKTDKELATERDEPYVSVLSVELDPNNVGAGAFELDWNDKFVAKLVRAGYQVKPNEPDSDIVDRWFQDVCRHVVLETYQNIEAMNPNTNQARPIQRKDLGNGKTEVS